jgi:hypothetical protein
MGTLHEDVHTFMTIPRSILLGMRSVSYQVAGKIKTYILFIKK